MTEEGSTVSPDGTALVSWHSTTPGPPVLVCGALGAPAQSWPALTAPDAGLHAFGWHYRGTFGSARPTDPSRIMLTDHVGDALAVLDSAGIDRASVIGWSSGATVAAELARNAPDRVTGLMMIAGPPGDLLATIRGPWGAAVDLVLGLTSGGPGPGPFRGRGLVKGVMSGGLDAMRLAAPLLAAGLPRLPPRQLGALLRHSGLLLPAGDPALLAEVLRPFLHLDWAFYAELLRAVGSVPALDITGLRCPVTALVGRHDVVSDARALTEAVGRLPQARVRILPTSHFIPLEAPEEVAAEALLLVERAAAVRRALDDESDHVPADMGPLTPRSRHGA
ncbi:MULTISPECIES: alpha/beta fold hydrolase [Actinoalloteichus]|uniref:Hydrolase or acyltransferase of alpha/beta superfamily n=1 Tax=Actinoalloteichus fjordicus TaxID=1612552 RepID=A0AAC9LHX1_9PSEU|nr:MULTISPECIES: alpha/beta hydrolase [Actinoalloteichus]APU17205.1 putative hydrolase or acyltransferase of alpha/beta superfamily [Actinoalloteichus fjordicus]APU23288.1 putative hydrolase or acyltransferase of alpha/beta superfamily [Actinoalloteichus sp. GBA129-24]